MSPIKPKTNKITLPAKWSELASDFNKLETSHNNFLRKHGVTMPKAGTGAAIQLVFLYRYKGKLVSLESIRKFVSKYWPKQSKDQQPRHLKYSGWYILLSGKSSDILVKDVGPYKQGTKLPNGYVMFVSETSPSPDVSLNKRRGKLNAADWESLQAIYNNSCAVCKKSGVPLEKGHCDPDGTSDLTNIIPMCSDCNNWASKDVVYDKDGKIISLATERFVKKSSLKAKLLIYDYLHNDKDVNKS